jgi:hypothetical protein
MNAVYNKDIDKWIRPWHIKKFDDLTTRDERFFSIVIKGCLNFLNRTILMYNEPINHFIFNTGSSYMYIESDGYEFKWSETTGEDQMYMHLPRCICEINDINIPISDLTNPYVRGIYERKSSKTNEYKGYNGQIRRLPLEISITLRYVLSNFNESIILAQEFIDKLVFQQYYQVNYLGQKIQCSIEFPVQTNININKIDFDSTEPNQKTIEMQIKINTYYPIINELTEIENSKVITSLDGNLNIQQENDTTDTHKYTID